MKVVVMFLLYILPVFALGQNGFVVKARLEGLGDKKVKIYYQKNGKYVVDTLSAVKKNIILWKGKTEDPQLVRMEVLDTSLYLRMGKALASAPSLMFLLNNTKINIQGSSKEIYKASLSSKDAEVKMYETFRKEDQVIIAETWSLQKQQAQKTNANDTIGIGAIKEQINFLRKKNQSIRWAYIDSNPQAFASLLFLQNLFLVFLAEDLDKKFDKLDEKYKNTATARALKQKIESNLKTGVGKPVIQFAQAGLDGKMVDVAALKGKVILIDFWGSWCVPCRRSHPELVELYKKYKSSGFEIIGVANENTSGNKAKAEQDIAWRKAIQEDQINWLHILYDPAFSDIIKAYDINGYPTKFLIDQNGNFVMRILGNSPQSHAQLIQKLEELFSKQQ